MNNPKVTVLLPVYNGENFISYAIESILSQSFEDFELMVIDDCSTDSSVEEISKFKDPRIHFIKNDSNIGLISTLNKGLRLSRGELIARMDQDDIAFPERLSEQIRYMEKNSNILLSGTNISLINVFGKKLLSVPNFGSEFTMEWNLAIGCSLFHPTVIFKKTTIINLGGYSEAFVHAEDYELWLRVLREGKVGNLNRKLLKYRKHSASISSKFQSNQSCSSIKALKIHYSKFYDLHPSEEIISIVLGYDHNNSYFIERELVDLLLKLKTIILKKNEYSKALKTNINLNILEILFKNNRSNFFEIFKPKKVIYWAKIFDLTAMEFFIFSRKWSAKLFYKLVNKLLA